MRLVAAPVTPGDRLAGWLPEDSFGATTPAAVDAFQVPGSGGGGGGYGSTLVVGSGQTAGSNGDANYPTDASNPGRGGNTYANGNPGYVVVKFQ